LRLLRLRQHLQHLFDVLLKVGRSIWTTANMRGHNDIGACPGRAIRIGHDDVGREFELDSAEIDSNGRDAIEIDKWRVLGTQCSGANRWQLGGLARLGHGYLPRLCETGTSSIKYYSPPRGRCYAISAVMLYAMLCYMWCYPIYSLNRVTLECGAPTPAGSYEPVTCPFRFRGAWIVTAASVSAQDAWTQAPCSPVIDRTQGNRQHECHPSQSGAMLRSIFGEDRGAFPANPRRKDFHTALAEP
jgi:hypothetical protein